MSWYRDIKTARRRWRRQQGTPFSRDNALIQRVLSMSNTINPATDKPYNVAEIAQNLKISWQTVQRILQQSQSPASELVVQAQQAGHNLSRDVRNKINSQLVSKGLDGTTYFNRVHEALNAIADVLGNNELSVEGVFGDEFIRNDKGQKSYSLTGSAQPGDPFTPGPQVNNSMLVVSWYKMDSGRYEVIAYLS